MNAGKLSGIKFVFYRLEQSLQLVHLIHSEMPDDIGGNLGIHFAAVRIKVPREHEKSWQDEFDKIEFCHSRAIKKITRYLILKFS